MVLSCLGGGDPNQRLEICRRSCNSREKHDSVYFSFPRWIAVVETGGWKRFQVGQHRAQSDWGKEDLVHLIV